MCELSTGEKQPSGHEPGAPWLGFKLEITGALGSQRWAAYHGDRQPPKALEIYTELQTPQRSNPQIYVHFSPCNFGHNLLPGLEIISKYYIFLLVEKRLQRGERRLF